jgi:glucose/arabinose dehydrogenase
MRPAGGRRLVAIAIAFLLATVTGLAPGTATLGADPPVRPSRLMSEGGTTTTAAVSAESVVPSGFTDSAILGGLTAPIALRFSPDGRVFVAEKSGLIKVYASLSATTATVVAGHRNHVHD